MEKISIIVPVYKVEQYLHQCIDSIIGQTYTNLEIILVNDGSPDGCGKICDEYREKDRRIIVIHKENGGLSDARNAGIRISTGKYIGFVDSDDYIEKDMYEFLYNLIIKYDADISICGRYELKDLDFPSNKKYKDICYTKELAIKEILKDDKLRSYAWDKLYKAKLFNDVTYPKGKYYEDMYTTYKLIQKSNKIVLNASPKYHYRFRKESITNRDFTSKNLDLIGGSEALLDFARENYPHFYKIQLNTHVRQSVGLLRKTIDAGYSDKETIGILQGNIRDNLFLYLFSKNKIKNKCFGLVASFNYNLASRIYNKIKKIFVRI